MLSKAHTLAALQHHFASVVPSRLAPSCTVIGLLSGLLSVAVANSTVAAKLRQLAPQVVEMLQNRGCEVSGIRVKVQVIVGAVRQEPTPRQLSKSACAELSEFSAGLVESPLKSALEKLVKKPVG